MSQTEWIAEALRKGPLTAMDALQGCGCFRLAARIKDLRDSGVEIETRDKRLANGKFVAEYALKKKVAA